MSVAAEGRAKRMENEKTERRKKWEQEREREREGKSIAGRVTEEE